MIGVLWCRTACGFKHHVRNVSGPSIVALSHVGWVARGFRGLQQSGAGPDRHVVRLGEASSFMRQRAVHQRLTLSTIALLIAAIALGLALAMPASRHLDDQSGKWSVLFHARLHATPVILLCSLTTLGLSLRWPRPPLKRLARWPGFVANAAGILGVFVMLPFFIGMAISQAKSIELMSIYVNFVAYGFPSKVGFFVIGALLPSMIRRDCCPRPTWEDQLGWWLGMLWIFMSLLTLAEDFLPLPEW